MSSVHIDVQVSIIYMSTSTSMTIDLSLHYVYPFERVAFNIRQASRDRWRRIDCLFIRVAPQTEQAGVLTEGPQLPSHFALTLR